MTQGLSRLGAAGLGLAALCVWAAPGLADGPDAFQPCLACHSVEPGVDGMAGPNLANMIGRPVGGDPAFGYSSVLSDAGQRETWSVELLEAFLEDPEGMFPGMWMSYPGISDPELRREIAAFIAGFSTGSG